MSCCGCLPTPESILEDDEIDVFESMVPNTDYEYSAKRTALWSAFRFRSIGNGNIPYWLQCMKDRYALVVHEYDIKIRAWRSYETSVASSVDFADSSSEYAFISTLFISRMSTAPGIPYLSLLTKNGTASMPN